MEPSIRMTDDPLIEDNLTGSVEDDEQEENVTFKYSISSYGADYPVDGLVKRLQNESIYVPIFQRGFVWTYAQGARFLESLLLGLPVPGIFLSREPETQKLIVIDGQQRLRTLQYFYEGVFADSEREFRLRNVQKQFEGATYKSLSEEDRRRLDDTIIHATVIRQDEPSEDQSSVYYIFERLNTGATPLTPQEIRASIYIGEFNELLFEMNSNRAWRDIFGPVNKRRRDQELILRFVSLYFYDENYSRPMKEFLNTYMGKNRHFKLHSSDQIKQAFSSTIETIHKCLGNKAFRLRRVINAAVFDAVMVAVARRLRRGPVQNRQSFKKAYDFLLQDARFLEATGKATADEESVSRRLELATRAFAEVQ